MTKEKVFIPKTPTDYKKLIWRFCNNCNGAKRKTDQCKNTHCDLFPVYNLPRQVTLNLENKNLLPQMLQAAIEVGYLYDTFTVTSVRNYYYRKHGNGNALNWGNFAKTKEFTAHFERCSVVSSGNLRSHGDLVILWRMKNILK